MTQSTEAKAAETPAKAKAKAKADGPQEFTLYNRDGREKVTTDPATVVNLEFNGWSQTKPETDSK